MSEETPFRLVTILLVASIVGTGAYYRVRAASSRERVSRKEEGLAIMMALRLFGFSMWIGLLLYMANPQWMAWAQLPLPAALRWFGAGLGILTLPLIHWMFRSLGRNVTDTVAIRRDHALVTHGPYRWVRHPMYSLSLLMWIAFTLLTANAFIGAAGLLALVLLMARTPIEERKLMEEFGDEYLAYVRRTGRFLPRRRQLSELRWLPPFG